MRNNLKNLDLLKVLQPSPNSQDFYDLRNKFTDVKGIIIQLRGNNKCLSLYKNKTNLTVFEQSRKLFNLIPDSDGYLKELPNQVFRLDYNYDLALWKMIFNKKPENSRSYNAIPPSN
nr:Kiwa anti-phage protein KwaB-like domain-containing protein [Klebsiella pneumoniae]